MSTANPLPCDKFRTFLPSCDSLPSLSCMRRDSVSRRALSSDALP